MTKNLTEGNPLKLIIMFSLPLLAGNLFQQTYNMVDAIIVGRYLGTQSLASVGASDSVIFLVLGFCMGVTGGFAIPVAQRFGASDFTSMRRYIFTGFVALGTIALSITTLCGIFCTPILRLLRTPEDILKSAHSYLFIIFMGIPFSMLYNYLSGVLRAVGDSRTPFIFLLIATFLNIVLDTVFIVIFGMGVKGAALATVIGQGVSGLLCGIHILRKFEVLHLRREDCIIEKEKLSFLLGMGIPMGLQFSITAIGSMYLRACNNSLGSVCISGFTAGNKLKQIFMCPYDAVGTAVATFASQNYGAGKADRIRKGIVQGTAVSAVYGIVASFVLGFFGRTLSMMFVNGAETAVLDKAQHYAFVMGFAYWTLGILNVLRPTVQGLGFTRRAIISGIIEMIARIFVCVVFVPKIAYTAVCCADITAWVTATIYITFTAIWCVRKISGQGSLRTA